MEQLGLELQKLATRAFPLITGKDFDRLLKGRFFQALLPRWQRKLGAPKPDESFDELFARARTTERREEQYNTTMGDRNGSQGGARRADNQPNQAAKAPHESVPYLPTLPISRDYPGFWVAIPSSRQMKLNPDKSRNSVDHRKHY